MNQKLFPLVLGTTPVASASGRKLLRRVILSLALSATILVGTAPAEAADVNVSNPSYPVTPAGNIGWDPGMTHARAIHWGSDNTQFWGSCPDDSAGCSSITVNQDQYYADFGIWSSLNPCHPNSGDAVTGVGSGWDWLPCPLYANWGGWFGTTGAKSYSTGINNYPWNRWNSPNIWAGLLEDKYRSASLNNRGLDNALLSLTVLSYLDRTYVQDGKAPRGQGRIIVGFTFIGANGLYYIVEMNFSNMRVNLNDHRSTADVPSGAPAIPLSNPWRDDLWAEYLNGDGSPAQPITYVIGARNWGYNLVEGQVQSIFFDPWWVAVNLLYPPPACPEMLNEDGTPKTTLPYDDPAGYGFVPCGYRSAYKLPHEALFDAFNQPTATIIGFYSGVEMGGSAVYGSTDIWNWTIQRRW
jgi:hypothetical protein